MSQFSKDDTNWIKAKTISTTIYVALANWCVCREKVCLNHWFKCISFRFTMKSIYIYSTHTCTQKKWILDNIVCATSRRIHVFSYLLRIRYLMRFAQSANYCRDSKTFYRLTFLFFFETNWKWCSMIILSPVQNSILKHLNKAEKWRSIRDDLVANSRCDNVR